LIVSLQRIKIRHFQTGRKEQSLRPFCCPQRRLAARLFSPLSVTRLPQDKRAICAKNPFWIKAWNTVEHSTWRFFTGAVLQPE